MTSAAVELILAWYTE